jgi:hypothetical protein
VPFVTKNVYYSLTLSLAETENMVNARNKFTIKADHARRFPPPRSIEDIGACFLVKDSSGKKLAVVYCEEEPGRRSAAKLLTKDEARRIAASVAKAVGAVSSKELDRLRSRLLRKMRSRLLRKKVFIYAVTVS